MGRWSRRSQQEQQILASLRSKERGVVSCDIRIPCTHPAVRGLGRLLWEVQGQCRAPKAKGTTLGTLTAALLTRWLQGASEAVQLWAR